MEEIKININELGDQSSKIVIPIGNFAQPLDNTSTMYEKFVNEEVEKAINPTIDYEKVRFVPFSGYTEVYVRLMKSGSTELTYSDLGFTNDDLKFRRNRFTKSFVKLNFYDTNNLSNRRLAFQSFLFSQINEDQRDVNGELLDVTNMPVTFRLTDPITRPEGVSEGFNLYWLKRPSSPYPLDFYMYASYNNASDGVESQFLAFDGQIPINLYSGLNWVRYRLTSIQNNNEFSIDDSNRSINFLSDKIEILLYPLNLT